MATVQSYRKRRADVRALIYEGEKSREAVREWVACPIDERLQGSGNDVHTLEIQPDAPHGQWYPVMLGDYIVLDAGEWRVVDPGSFEKQYEQRDDPRNAAGERLICPRCGAPDAEGVSERELHE